MKIVPIGTIKPKKIPLYRNREAIDKVKDMLVREHNEKFRERTPPEL